MANNPHYDPSRSHHCPDGFRNPPGNPQWHRNSLSVAAAFARFARDMWRLRHERSPFSDDHRLNTEQTLQGLENPSSKRTLTWLGHASFLLRLHGCHILTDPFLSDYASPAAKRLVPPALRAHQVPSLDLILISHNHYDHLDRASLQILASRFPNAQVLVPLGLGRLLKACGFSRIHELDWYDSFHHGRITVTATPALHMARRGLTDMNQTLWCGFAIRDEIKDKDRHFEELEEDRYWQCHFSGDTAQGPVFDEVGERLGPFDVAMVPIGAYEPRRLMHCVHATPEEALQIAGQLRARHAIPMHWGSIRLTTEPMDEPPRRFLAASSTIPRRLMAIGETICL
ncbi:MAG: MBL fold metallo-hydrolase [Oleiphilaceae bacterium]|nr:MBL fold metallo-hydrolase [Oleiphilaceae bacterium]